ncbi:MAG: PKD domain-containing protein [Acidimicrobiales bacterium]
MGVRRDVSVVVLVLATAVAAVIGPGIAPVGAAGDPTAELSINPAHRALTVTFIASSVDFPAPVVSYEWTFGDGKSKETKTRTVSHTYPSASTFQPTLVEADSQGQKASATGTLQLFQCSPSSAQCTKSVKNVGKFQLLQATGPIGSAQADVDLFVGPLKIANCEPQVAPAAAVTDSGFSGNLTVTLRYTTTHPTQLTTTCFSSTVAFADTAGKTVKSGALPTCQSSGQAKVPCVQSVAVSASKVFKVLLIPPGDPKVGGP